MTTINQLVTREMNKQPFVLYYRRHGQVHNKPFDTYPACMHFAVAVVSSDEGTPLAIKRYGRIIWADPVYAGEAGQVPHPELVHTFVEQARTVLG